MTYIPAVLLSVRQPWADLLVDGTKTVETRRRLKVETFAPGMVVLVYATAPTKAVIGHFVSGGVLVAENWGGLLGEIMARGLDPCMSVADWAHFQPRYGLIATEARRWKWSLALTHDTPVWTVGKHLSEARVKRAPRSYQLVEVPADLLTANGWRYTCPPTS